MGLDYRTNIVMNKKEKKKYIQLQRNLDVINNRILLKEIQLKKNRKTKEVIEQKIAQIEIDHLDIFE
jgi:hypothetical protein